MAEITVKGFSGGKYQTFKYDPDTTQSGAFFNDLRRMLAASGYFINWKGPLEYYNLELEKAVKEFQQDIGEAKTGVIGDELLRKIIEASKSAVSDLINEEQSDETEEDVLENEHFDSFFSENNTKDFRKNKTDIVIKFGNGINTKTIHEIYMRSAGVEVDTSGNPVFETYEFVAKDVTETDEENDNKKYGNKTVKSAMIQTN